MVFEFYLRVLAFIIQNLFLWRILLFLDAFFFLWATSVWLLRVIFRRLRFLHFVLACLNVGGIRRHNLISTRIDMPLQLILVSANEELTIYDISENDILIVSLLNLIVDCWSLLWQNRCSNTLLLLHVLEWLRIICRWYLSLLKLALVDLMWPKHLIGLCLSIWLWASWTASLINSWSILHDKVALRIDPLDKTLHFLA